VDLTGPRVRRGKRVARVLAQSPPAATEKPTLRTLLIAWILPPTHPSRTEEALESPPPATRRQAAAPTRCRSCGRRNWSASSGGSSVPTTSASPGSIGRRLISARRSCIWSRLGPERGARNRLPGQFTRPTPALVWSQRRILPRRTDDLPLCQFCGLLTDRFRVLCLKLRPLRRGVDFYQTLRQQERKAGCMLNGGLHRLATR
jgi:hypothetical protein